VSIICRAKTITLPFPLDIKREGTEVLRDVFDALSLYSKGEGEGEGFLLAFQIFILTIEAILDIAGALLIFGSTPSR
jgi:hypothetical protein